MDGGDGPAPPAAAGGFDRYGMPTVVSQLFTYCCA
jgi:hypothetical protein